jgi:hypothetical protein
MNEMTELIVSNEKARIWRGKSDRNHEKPVKITSSLRTESCTPGIHRSRELPLKQPTH